MKKKQKIWIIVGVCLALAIAMVAPGVVFGMFSEETSVHIEPSQIENSTLVIGTHLIHLSALTDAIYDIASKSATESGQTEIYYKSELADGAWFDITTASSIAEITTGGFPVPSETIAALFFTHHTKSDGVTYDLRTGRAVNIYEIEDPYDLENSEELEPLKTQYDLMEEYVDERDGDAKKETQANIDRTKALFDLNVENGDTAKCDKQLEQLQLLSSNLEGEQLDELQKIMDAIDAQRRLYVLNQLDEQLQAFSEAVLKDKNPDTILQSAINDSLQNVKESIIECEGKILTPGTSIISEIYYGLAMDLLEGDSDALKELVILEHIRSDKIVDRIAELEMLDKKLLPRAKSKYTEAIGAGVSSEYKALKQANEPDAVLKNQLSTDAGEMNSLRSQLEFLITSRGQRSGNEEGMTYLDSQLLLAECWYELVVNDEFQLSAENSIDTYIEFLTKFHRQMELAAGGNALDALAAEKDQLQTEMMSALDKNDLKTASEIEKKIEKIDDEMAELAAKGYTTDGILASAAADQKKSCLDTIKSSDLTQESLDNLNSGVDALIGMLEMDPAVVFPMLKDLHQEMALKAMLENTTAFDDTMAVIEEAILNNMDAYKASLKDEKDATALEDIFNDFISPKDGLFDTDTGSSSSGLGSDSDSNTDAIGGGSGGNFTDTKNVPDISDLNEDEQSAVLLSALQMYYEQTRSDKALQILISTARRQIELGNELVFIRYNDGGLEYLPITALRQYTGMRYVYYANREVGTLARGGTFYGFTAYSEQVQRSTDNNDADRMPRQAMVQQVIHIPEEYTETEFGAYAIYLSGCEYGVLTDEAYQLLAEELLTLFLT